MEYPKKLPFLEFCCAGVPEENTVSVDWQPLIGLSEPATPLYLLFEMEVVSLFFQMGSHPSLSSSSYFLFELNLFFPSQLYNI